MPPKDIPKATDAVSMDADQQFGSALEAGVPLITLATTRPRLLSQVATNPIQEPLHDC
jgi:hypothetical protein